jgi:hypothetical protein
MKWAKQGIDKAMEGMMTWGHGVYIQGALYSVPFFSTEHSAEKNGLVPSSSRRDIFLLSQEGVELGGGLVNAAVAFLLSMEGAVTKRTRQRKLDTKSTGWDHRVMVMICGPRIDKSLPCEAIWSILTAICS